MAEVRRAGAGGAEAGLGVTAPGPVLHRRGAKKRRGLTPSPGEKPVFTSGDVWLRHDVFYVITSAPSCQKCPPVNTVPQRRFIFIRLTLCAVSLEASRRRPESSTANGRLNRHQRPPQPPQHRVAGQMINQARRGGVSPGGVHPAFVALCPAVFRAPRALLHAEPRIASPAYLVTQRLLPEEPRSRRLMTSDQDTKVVAEPQVQQVQEAKESSHLESAKVSDLNPNAKAWANHMLSLDPSGTADPTPAALQPWKEGSDSPAEPGTEGQPGLRDTCIQP
ncbi:unnamed protein product [Menidia menidia]|uniref:(Atlantic silverside) hypothetical protein n=1 Tax=Menidia menidia TaxID=238744 RepID=A0A8S4BX06_9TELE|nr:unnamed protein product [Menidia menidia]CAG6016205.1 unnamed protein product [Menidia menidia]